MTKTKYFPNVTSILWNTRSTEQEQVFKDWIEKVGETEAQEIKKKSMVVGKLVDEAISDILTKDSFDLGTIIKYQPLEIKAIVSDCLLAVKPFLKQLSNPSVQVDCTHPYLKYKGTIDCMATIYDPTLKKEVQVLIDWKVTYRGLHKKEWLLNGDYPLQIAAYLDAYNSTASGKEFNNKKADCFVRGLLVNISTDSFQVIEIDTDHYMNSFLNRWRLYHKKKANGEI